ncbi:hypothetical protein ACFV9C_01815 [Kribbella sp. NPDC059898]|uniref:hypothetical protein n=1 Tax=Kribbella sp. NPDC059898 TaxID=3346995 RepID=UPI00364691F7
MRTLVDGFREMVHLIGDTFRLWWKNLLPMSAWWAAGFLGFTLCSQGAIWLAKHTHSSLGTGLFAVGVLLQITATVGMIRTCAMSLYRWRDAASSEAEETADPTQRGLLELLAVTLLPLVAVWSAWGFFDKQVSQLSATDLVQNGLQEGGGFFKVGIHSWHNYLPALIILLVLRRVLQSVDDRWPSRPVKFAQVWAESFFVLLTVVITPFAISEGKEWLKDRSFWYWSLDWWDGLKGFFDKIHIPIPAGIEFLWGFFWDSLWPLFKDGIAEPLTWLAITTVVFGHRVLSSGGVFRGTRIERRLGAHGAQEEEPQRGRLVSLTYKAPDLVLGGLREKFYPAINAFRLLVRVGPVFLGVVCLVYTLWWLADDWAFVVLERLIGIHGSNWGLMDMEIASMIGGLIFEPLRIALLAAAFDLCISVGTERRVEAKAIADAKAPQAAQPVTAGA